MLSLQLPEGELEVLCVGAHPDDIEIGCGATLLTLAAVREMRLTSVVLTGSGERAEEARKAAGLFAPGVEVDVQVSGLPDGRLPARWGEVKETLEQVGREVRPDVIFAPRRDDAHQDHQLLAELVPTVWRDAFVLGYEIPKWDGDLGPATHLVPIADDVARRKVDLLTQCFASQTGRDWWDDEMFLGLMRLRGMQCRTRYAEAFTVAKAVLEL